VAGDAGKLVGSQSSEPARLEIHNIVQADEMYAVVVEAVPALTLGAFAVAVEIGLSQALVDEVVLAGNVVHVEVCFTDQLGGVVELIRLGKVGDVTCMDHEGG